MNASRNYAGHCLSICEYGKNSMSTKPKLRRRKRLKTINAVDLFAEPAEFDKDTADPYTSLKFKR